MRLFTLLALVLPLAASAQGTGTISGRVTDDTGFGLPGANVVLEGTALGTATDVDGTYSISGIPAGTYHVTASFTGYRSTSTEVTVDVQGAAQTRDFMLEDPRDRYVDPLPVWVRYRGYLSSDHPYDSRVLPLYGWDDIALINLPIAR